MTTKKSPAEKITTIKLLDETKLRIEKLRQQKGETYDDILKKILYILNIAREEPDKAKRILEKISELRIRMLEEEKQQKENLRKENERKE